MTQEPDAPSWRPVVTDPAQRERIQQVIRDIVAGVDAFSVEARHLDPLTDRAILRTFLSQDGAIPDDDDVGGAMLARAVTTFGEGGYPASLYAGAGKIGWTVAHLAGGEEADE